MSVKHKFNFKVIVLDENLLDKFYFKWYQKWGDSKGVDIDKIKDIFNQSIVYNANPELFLSVSDLSLEHASHDYEEEDEKKPPSP